MSKFNRIFDVFSRRDHNAKRFVYSVPETLREKIILLCRDEFGKPNYFGKSYVREFWYEIHRMLLYRHGKSRLMGEVDFARDTIQFLLTCPDDEFLDFVEYIFRVECLHHIPIDANALVAEINELFASEDVGYELTNMIVKEEPSNLRNAPSGNVPLPITITKARPAAQVISYPQITRKDDQITHTTITIPALTLLSDPRYQTANQEYLEALEDYRNGDYGDCLTKCGSAFESVMKIICDSKGWQYDPERDTVSKLLDIIFNNGGIHSYLKQTFIAIAQLRNRLSKSHGAGVTPRKATQNYARYALNATASAIVFLVNEIEHK